MGGLRNETMAGGGMRNGNVSSDQRAGLDPPTAALVQVAAALAEGKIAGLQQRLAAARLAAVPDPALDERLLPNRLRVGASALWGGLSTGASRGEVEGVLAVSDGDLDAERRRRAREQWEDVMERKL